MRAICSVCKKVISDDGQPGEDSHGLCPFHADEARRTIREPEKLVPVDKSDKKK